MKVEIVKGTAFELDPEKKYVIFIDPTSTTKDNLSLLSKALFDKGIQHLVVAQDPETVKIVEAK